MEEAIIKDENITTEEESTDTTTSETTESIEDTEMGNLSEDEEVDAGDDALIEDDAEDLEEDESSEDEEEEDVPSITVGTIVRTILLAIGIVNLILTCTGHSPLPFDSDDVNMTVSAIYQAVVSVIAWWKDNDFTIKARLRKAEK